MGRMNFVTYATASLLFLRDWNSIRSMCFCFENDQPLLVSLPAASSVVVACLAGAPVQSVASVLSGSARPHDD